MDEARFQEEMFNLAAFMVTSARGLYDEPADYGPFRLVDTAGRLLAALEAVEMNLEPAAGYNPEADACPAGTARYTTLFSDGFESGLGNWTTWSGRCCAKNCRANWASGSPATSARWCGPSLPVP